MFRAQFLLIRVTAFLLLAFAHSAPVHAWGAEGHRIVCAVAEQHLSEVGRAFLQDVMQDSPDLDGQVNSEWSKSFAQACVWADDVKFGNYRGSYEHHFVNVPKDAASLEVSRDCPALNCLLTAIQRHLTHLAAEPSGRRDRVRRVAALRFLGHYVGDLHQPLHVSHAEDWGGNKIRVTFFGEETNLHRIWDVDAAKRMGLTHRQTPASRNTTPSGVLAWAGESLTLARSTAYRLDGREIKIGDELGESYQSQVAPVIERRLAEAGVRLAGLINQTAAGERVQFLRVAGE